MKLPQLKKVLREDLPPDAPDWINMITDTLNSFMDAIYSGVNKNLTMAENLDMQLRSVSFRTESSYVASNTWVDIKFARTTKKKAEGVLIADIKKTGLPYDTIYTSSHVHWLEEDGNIIVKFIAGLADSTNYTVKLLVI